MGKQNTIKLYPWFSSLSSDLLFFVAVDTLFLTIAVEMTPFLIALMITIGTLVCILLQYPLLKIIKIIGNQNSIRVGTFLLFLSAVFYTTANIICAFIACIFYYIALFFIEMKVNILKNNINKQDNATYMKTEAKAKLLYSVYTLIIICISAPLFNLNHYIPMFLCVFFAFCAFIFSFFIKDIKQPESQQKEITTNSLPKSIKLIIISSILFVPLLVVASTNAKLLTQEIFESLFSLDKIVYFVSGIVLAMRIARVISVSLFSKYCNKVKHQSLFIMSVLLLISVLFVFVGGLVQDITGYVFITLGCVGLFALIDPYQIVIKNLIIKQTSNYQTQKALSLNYSSINIGNLFLNICVTLFLIKINLSYLFILFIFFALIEIVIILILIKTFSHQKIIKDTSVKNSNKITKEDIKEN